MYIPGHYCNHYLCAKLFDRLALNYNLHINLRISFIPLECIGTPPAVVYILHSDLSTLVFIVLESNLQVVLRQVFLHFIQSVQSRSRKDNYYFWMHIHIDALETGNEQQKWWKQR